MTDSVRNVIMKRSLLLTILAFAPAWSGASEIYQWTDDDGIVHFSDTRPEQDVVTVTLYVRDLNPPGYDPATDPYSIRNQAERMNATWTELAEAKAEREEKRREEAERYRDFVPPPYDPYDYGYRPFYYAPPHTIRQRPGLARRQFQALDELGLTAPRPNSINSGRHQARVETSRVLPLAAPKPGPRRHD